jgi:hypothetical protein
VAYVIRTTEDQNDNVTIAGLGELMANGQSAFRVEDAALVMSELQERDEFGRLKLSNGNPIPLKGTALNEAAKAWAQRFGLEVANVKEADIPDWSRGAAPDGTDLMELAEQTARARAGLPVLNDASKPARDIVNRGEPAPMAAPPNVIPED